MWTENPPRAQAAHVTTRPCWPSAHPSPIAPARPWQWCDPSNRLPSFFKVPGRQLLETAMPKSLFGPLILLLLSIELARAQETAPATPPSELRCADGTNLNRNDPFHQRLANTVQLSFAPCSGSLVTFAGRSRTQKALVLTAGH